MFCPNCGTQLPDNAGFCSNCGYSVSGATAAGVPRQGNLSIEIIKRVFAVLGKKPFLLWGLSLLCMLLSFLAYLGGGSVIAIGFAVSLVLSLGMEWIYLDGYRGKEINSKQLFEPFKNFWKSFAGMGWRELWLFLWSLIPFAGVVFGTIKYYAYLFTPYLLRNSEFGAQEALKESMSRTNGYKGKMFLTDLLISVAIFVPAMIFYLLGMLCAIDNIVCRIFGVMFLFLYFVFMVVCSVFLPLFCGLVRAAWFEEICGEKEE